MTSYERHGGVHMGQHCFCNNCYDDLTGKAIVCTPQGWILCRDCHIKLADVLPATPEAA